MVRMLMAVSLVLVTSQVIYADDLPEQVEIFGDVSWPSKDKDGKTQLEKANMKLEEIQKEHTITRVMYVGGAQHTSDYHLLVFYKPGRPKQIEKMMHLSGFANPNSRHYDNMTGQEWMNSELKRIQGEHRITHMAAAMAGPGGTSGSLIIFCTKKK